MGLFGTWVVCRSAEPVDEMAVLEEVLMEPAGAQWWGDRWQVGEFTDQPDDPGQVAVDLVADTGSPALVILVEDSSIAVLFGLGVTTGSWCQVIPDRFREEFPDMVFPDQPDAIAAAMAWARDAGWNPDSAAALTAANTDPDPFVQDVLTGYLTALGLPPRVATVQAD